VSPEKSQKQSGQVTFLSGEMVPISGVWRIAHDRCPDTEDVWLYREMPFPPCPGCGSSVHYALVEEILHISEDPDFQ
jgi:hypothetical protein